MPNANPAVYIVEYWSHESAYHWEESARFQSATKAEQHYLMKCRTFPNTRWRLIQLLEFIPEIRRKHATQ